MLPSDNGAWYRLGYLEKSSQIYGEFIVTHSWSNHAPELSKFIVAGGCWDADCFNIKEIFASWHNNPNVQSKPIRKARAVYYPRGTDEKNIYIDIFLQNFFTYSQRPDTWFYCLNQNGVFAGSAWIDENFGAAEIPTGYRAKEISFVWWRNNKKPDICLSGFFYTRNQKTERRWYHARFWAIRTPN